MQTLRDRAAFSALLLGAAACNTSQYWTVNERLWSPQTVSAADGTYVRLPFAGGLIRVRDNGNVAVVDLDGAEPTRLVLTPDGEQVLVFARWPQCKDDDPKITREGDCDSEDLVYRTELALVEGGDRQGAPIEIPPHLNTVSFSEDGAIAVAYLDYVSGQEISIDGVADLGEVRFLNLDTEEQGSVSVGFSPERVLFSQDNTSAVVMSRSKIIVVNLTDFEVVLEAPLTLDPDEQVDPSGAALTPDGGTLLVTVRGSSDLYMLDLDTVFWNLGVLDAEPSTLAVDPQNNRSVFVFSGSSEVNVLDNDGLSAFSQELIESIPLDEPSNQIRVQDGQAILYNNSSGDYHDVYRLDLDNLELTEYVLENPVSELQLTPSGRYAVAIVRPEGGNRSTLDGYQDARWGLGVLNLDGDEAVSLVTETQPLGVAVIEDGETSSALVLLADREYLLYLDLSNPSVKTEVPLPAAPVSLDTLADGRFLITHDASLGLISYLDPTDLSLTSIDGFATVGLLRDDLLPRRDEGEQ
ncbi:MAG: hypothetical protein AAFV53_40205 [Myxococcota bacterium]